MNLFTWLFGRPSTPSTPSRRRLALEPLESRELLSASPISANPIISTPNNYGKPITDVQQLAQIEFQRDGTLTRTDAMSLFDLADGSEVAVTCPVVGVTFLFQSGASSTATLNAKQLSELHAIFQNPQQWNMASYVANLGGKVVEYDLANENYQGAPLVPSGQLQAGEPAYMMADLVDKWFLGTDLPSTAGFTDPNTNQSPVYAPANGSLFAPNGPSANDVAQGWAADCYFMSALGEVARTSPQTIENMFISNADGTYTVQFYEWNSQTNSAQADYVTVNLELPIYSNGAFFFAGYQQFGKASNYQSSSNILWPALAEKAYAQLAEEGWSRNPNGQNFSTGFTNSNGTVDGGDQNAYATLNYGTFAGLQQLTGAAYYTWEDFRPSHKQDMINAYNNGDAILMCTPSSYPANTPQDNSTNPLIPNHMYMLQSVNEKPDGQYTFTFVNPYDDGAEYSPDGARTVTLTWQQLSEYGYTFAYVPVNATN